MLLSIDKWQPYSYALKPEISCEMQVGQKRSRRLFLSLIKEINKHTKKCVFNLQVAED